MPDPLILIVDDNREIREFLQQAVFAAKGYRVACAADGRQALEMARHDPPDVLITDQQMPFLSGLELADALRPQQPDLPVILITGEHTRDLERRALAAGVMDIFVKPFDPEDLLKAVERALAVREHNPAGARPGAAGEDLALGERLNGLEGLSRVGRAVTALLDLDEILTTVVDAAVELTGAEEASLLLVDEESGDLYMRASKNFDEDFSRTFRLKAEDSLAGRVINLGKPLKIDQSSPQKIKTSYLVHSLLYCPLSVRGKVLGVLGIDNRTAGKGISAEHERVIEALADYAAIAIDNAQLYERLEGERNKLETILREVASGVLVVDPAGRLLFVNRVAAELFAIERDWQGKPFDQVVRHAGLLRLMRASAERSHRDEIELEDGRIFGAVRAPIEGVGFAVVLQDITHLKKLDRIKSDFVTAVSHDLRSPLTSILGYVELIERAGPVNELQRQFIAKVQSSVDQITRLINDLLDLGKIEAGLDTRMVTLQLEDLLHLAVQQAQESAQAKGLRVEIQVDGSLPPMRGDPMRLQQMFSNLLDNAIKYTDPGGRVRLSAGVEGGQIIVHVSDTGMGIPAADQPHLFDKFYRASNVPEDSSGTGLGLSIVKSIVETHKGRIWVESALGEGTTFSVVFPALDEPGQEA